MRNNRTGVLEDPCHTDNRTGQPKSPVLSSRFGASLDVLDVLRRNIRKIDTWKFEPRAEFVRQGAQYRPASQHLARNIRGSRKLFAEMTLLWLHTGFEPQV